MRILHVISDISREAGGPSRSSQGLVSALVEAGCDVRLLSLQPGNIPWMLDQKWFLDAAESGYRGHWAAMEDAIRTFHPELIHVHAIWKFSCHVATACARKHHIPYIIAPRGMLEPWSLEQKKWKKSLAMFLYQKNDLKMAAALHATAESEAEQFRRLGFAQPIIISPNGVNVPDSLPEPERNGNQKKRALFMSRIHYKKGLLELLEAWVQTAPPDWKLEIAGPDADGYQKVIEARVAELGLNNSVFFSGAHPDDRKWDVYRNASLFVLPSFSENFGIVIAEALYAGLPVITTTATPWRELGSRHCGWWTGTGTSACAEALKQAFALPVENLRKMGTNGHRLIEEKYMWPAIARTMRQEYLNLLQSQDICHKNDMCPSGRNGESHVENCR